jgi:outer membrane protein OmpA-like peptidoglycan-associated protein
MARSILLLMVVCLVSFAATAQVSGDLPENPEPGKCYVKCITPDVFETIEEQYMIKPAYKKLKVVPAEYKIVEERIMIKPVSKKYVYHPAEWETYYDEYPKEDPYNKITLVNPEFGGDSKRVEIHPEVNRWEYSAISGCESENPYDCRVLCYKQYPAIYDNFPFQTLIKDASYTKAKVGGATQQVKKQKIVKAAYCEEIEIPAEYTTINKRVLVKDETVVEETIPAVYETYTREAIQKKGGLTVWKEIECELLNYTVLPIYYDLGSARLTPEAKKTIDNTLLVLMKNDPDIMIELSSHTDSRSSADFNMNLSQLRAQSVVNYLMANGINGSRLVAKGYGETRLLNRCSDGITCTEKEHQMNRRTEFRVISAE